MRLSRQIGVLTVAAFPKRLKSECCGESQAHTRSAVLDVQGKVFKVSSGTVQWYRNSYGANFDNSDVANPDMGHTEEPAV